MAGLRTAVLMAVLVPTLTACVRSSGTATTTVVRRLLPEGEPRLATTIPVDREAIVERWDLADVDEMQRWTPERIDGEWRHTGRGIFLRSSSPDPGMTRACDVDASRVTSVRVEHSGLTPGAWVQLYWAREGEEFAEHRSVAATVKDATGDLMTTFTFVLGGHPEWMGRITRVRLDPTSEADRRVEVFGVSLIDRRPDLQLLGAALDRPWLVDLDGDVRPAVLAVPGEPYRVDLDVPEHAVLRFATGMTDGGNSILEPVLRVDGRELELGPRPAPCPPGASCGWADHRLDLEEWAGRRVSIELAASDADGGSPGIGGFLAWAGLEVAAPAGPSTAKRPNVVLIVLDTLRADRTSMYGCERDTTPRLAEWSRDRAVVFEQVVAPAPWTLPSHVSLFTGLDTVSHGVNTGDPVPESIDLLAERLARAGYATRAITGGGYLAADYGLMSGFDRLTYWARPKVDPAATGDDLEAGLAAALEWLESGPERPFFLFFHTYEVHSPYRLREPYFTALGGSERPDLTPPVNTRPNPPTGVNGLQITASFVAQKAGSSDLEPLEQPDELVWVRDLYDSTVARTDAAIGELLDRLRDLGLDDDTIVVVTSDHGESLGEGGIGGHSSLQECEIMVPLVIAGPGLETARGRRVPQQVRLIDLVPTLDELLGVEPAAPVDGTSLAALATGAESRHPEDAWVYASSSNFGLALRRNGRLKYTYCNTPWPPTGGGEALVELPGGTAVSDGTLAASLRELAKKTYYSGIVGAHVELSNRRASPMNVVLKGRVAEHLRIKLFEPEGLEIDGRGHQLTLTVPPGASYRIVLEGEPFGDLFVSAQYEDLPPGQRGLREVLRLERLVAPWRVAWSAAAGWTVGGERGPDTVVEVRAAGLERNGAAPAGIDETTREALRQLGYLQ